MPVASAREVLRAFERMGWSVHRQKGSHVSLHKTGHPALLAVPVHDPVAKGTLRKLIRLADITVEEFAEALKS